MRMRTKYGDKNIIGKKVYELRISKGIKQKDFIAQIQIEDVDINPSSFSKIEGQHKTVTDKEVKAIAKVLGISTDVLLDMDK